jgi:hypothetical protein
LTDIVQPGELYVLTPQNPACKPASGETLCYAIAKQPLKAMLNFQLDSNAASNETCSVHESTCPFLNQQNCHLFCTDHASPSSISEGWDVSVLVRPTWEFAALNGRILEKDVPDNSLSDCATDQMNDESYASLHITWDRMGWHVMLLADARSSYNPTCAQTQDEVLYLEPPVGLSGMAVYLQWQFASGTLAAAGCVAVGTAPQNVGSTTSPTHSSLLVAYCLHRFGVLLAVNNEAHRLWPYLPLADTHEQQLATLIKSGSSI